jgi:hypothetical protein
MSNRLPEVIEVLLARCKNETERQQLLMEFNSPELNAEAEREIDSLINATN